MATASIRSADAATEARLGEILTARGALTPERLRAALDAQRENGARLGEIVGARGWATAAAISDALATQRGLPRADLATTPLDPALLDPRDLQVCLRRRMAPWRRDAEGVVWAATDAEQAAQGFAEMAAPPRAPRIALVPPVVFEGAFAAAHGRALALRAATRTPEALSARGRRPRWLVPAGLSALAGLGLTAALVPGLGLALVVLTLMFLNAMNGVLRISALGAALARAETVRDPRVEPAPRLAPKITLLVALHREPETAPALLTALERLDWPAEKLEVKLLIEADDAETKTALEALSPPPFCRILVVPPGLPRTKPRALNYGLDVSDGALIGVYDAEDLPDPKQLRAAAAALAAAPPEVAAIQCRLSYFNPEESWLARCFTLEYALWFDVLLGGYRALGLPIPLGGTSVFFRRTALEDVGGWDAHNVTEDADLGMRLARRGYRVELVASTTMEEANARLLPWIKQRSRWLKGYAQTWLTHMRRPRRLLADLGLRRFLGFQAILLGGLVAYFGLPVFWTLWIATLLGAGPAWIADAPPLAFGALVTLHLSAWMATFLAALIALRRRGLDWLLPWTPTLFVYWSLGAAAAALALAELAVAPFHWRKTAHGVGPAAKALRSAALTVRRGAAAGPAHEPASAAAG